MSDDFKNKLIITVLGIIFLAAVFSTSLFYDKTVDTVNIESTYIDRISEMPLNINTATEAELKMLPGIGPTRAENIINYRNINGDFEDIYELVNVKNIGEKTVENIKNYITAY